MLDYWITPEKRGNIHCINITSFKEKRKRFTYFIPMYHKKCAQTLKFLLSHVNDKHSWQGPGDFIWNVAGMQHVCRHLNIHVFHYCMHPLVVLSVSWLSTDLPSWLNRQPLRKKVASSRSALRPWWILTCLSHRMVPAELKQNYCLSHPPSQLWLMNPWSWW